jgi:hypothetical protein
VSTGIFPERLKYSIIKPLCKKGDKTVPSNYRPISMQTSFSKGLEKALYNRLIEYLNNNNILNSQQFGFRKNLATEDAIFFSYKTVPRTDTNTETGGCMYSE